MTGPSHMAKLGAITAAIAIHGALAWALMPADEVRIEGAAGVQDVRLGTSFADMAAGVLAPVAAEDVAEPVAPESAEHAARPIRETVRPVTATPSPETPTVERLAPEQAAPLAPLAADAVASQPAIVPPMADEVRDHAQETLIAQEDVPPAISRSLRPRPRSAAFEKEHEKAPPPKRKAQKKTPEKPRKKSPEKATRGNAAQDATAGGANGSATAASKSPGGASGQAATPGNAAASNYPGLVMRRISQVPRPRSNSRGTAVVAFSIGGNGGLTGISVARSSGSAALDQAALRMVQRAAPFPPPPAGAKRSFSISIKGR